MFTSTLDLVTTTRDGFFVNTSEQHFSYPLNIDFSFLFNSDGSLTQTTTVSQKDLISESKSLNGFKFYESNLNNEVNTTDTLPFNSSGAFLGPTGSKTTQTYSTNDSLGHCYSRALTAAAQVLTSVEDGKDCKPDHIGR